MLLGAQGDLQSYETSVYEIRSIKGSRQMMEGRPFGDYDSVLRKYILPTSTLKKALNL